MCLSALLTAALFALPMPAVSSPGGLDKNGCHYDTADGHYHCHKGGTLNTDVNAPVKKGRDNICHDDRSPEYRYLRYFISYYSMNECVASGGVEYRH
ncbi:MAG TPA: YHYH domain-containing protein [Steroidobacteraceae bacterium]|jgi:hypothetical protein|nr:YHYH domain-containing protein [Steroidobacteraceae bacterium]